MAHVMLLSRTLLLAITLGSLLSAGPWLGMLAHAQDRRVSLGTFEPPTNWRVEKLKISSDGQAPRSDSQSVGDTVQPAGKINRLPISQEQILVAEGPALGLSIAPATPAFGYEITSFFSQRSLALSSEAVRISSDRGELIARVVQNQQAKIDLDEKTIEFVIYGNVDGSDYAYDYQFVYSDQNQRVLRASATTLRGDGYEVDYTTGEAFRLTKADNSAKVGLSEESLNGSSTGVANSTADITCIINNLMECSTYIGLLEAAHCVVTLGVGCLSDFLKSILIDAFCGITTTCTPRPSFSLSATPSSLTIPRGQSGSFSVQATFTGGFSASISGFDVTNLPSGVTRSNSPGTISSNGGRVTLSLNVSSTATIGSKLITISATGGGKTKTTTALLNIDLGQGTIQINAFLNDFPWSGSLTWALTGIKVAGGTSVPRTLSDMPTGSYGLTHVLGWPSNSALVSTSPLSQTLNASTTATFTFKFVTPPTDPSNLGASTLSSSKVALSWYDNSNREIEFRIERKRTANGIWSEFTKVGANVRSYTDTSLSSNTTYYYRVRASNSAGNSGYSNQAAVTTPK